MTINKINVLDDFSGNLVELTTKRGVMAIGSTTGPVGGTGIYLAQPLIIPSMSVTLPAGTYKISYNTEFRVTDTSSVTSIAKSELISLYNSLSTLSSTVTTHATTYGGGETLSPGVYANTGAINITGTLTLNGGGNSNALFIIRTAGAFTTAASSNVVLTNGATSSNVWFVSEGASSTGANSYMRGNLIANQAAVSVATGSTIEGRMFAVTGAAGVTASSFTSSIPVGTNAANLGTTLLDFSIFCGVGNITNSGVSSVSRNIGTDSGTITGFESSTIEGTLFPSGTDTLGKVFSGIYIDGVLFESSAHSATRTFRDVGSEYAIILQSVITVTQNQVVDIRAYTSIGKVMIGPNMILIAQKLGTVITV
jgi:hypothetical protein